MWDLESTTIDLHGWLSVRPALQSLPNALTRMRHVVYARLGLLARRV